jgi:hypothetical protein
MAYSQYFIHHKALSSTLSSTLNTAGLPYSCDVGINCKASNVIQSTLLIWNNKPGTTPCCIYSTPETAPNITVTIKANAKIDLVLLTPSDQDSNILPILDITAW